MHTHKTTVQHMVRNVLILMAKVISLPYVESPAENSPNLPNTPQQYLYLLREVPQIN